MWLELTRRHDYRASKSKHVYVEFTRAKTFFYARNGDSNLFAVGMALLKSNDNF